jgi:hypothetical protein
MQQTYENRSVERADSGDQAETRTLRTLSQDWHLGDLGKRRGAARHASLLARHRAAEGPIAGAADSFFLFSSQLFTGQICRFRLQ